jgi:hypothetical protein
MAKPLLALAPKATLLPRVVLDGTGKLTLCVPIVTLKEVLLLAAL